MNPDRLISLDFVISANEQTHSQFGKQQHLLASRRGVLASRSGSRPARRRQILFGGALPPYLLPANLPRAQAPPPKRRFLSHDAGSGKKWLPSVPPLPSPGTVGIDFAGEASRETSWERERGS